MAANSEYVWSFQPSCRHRRQDAAGSIQQYVHLHRTMANRSACHQSSGVGWLVRQALKFAAHEDPVTLREEIRKVNFLFVGAERSSQLYRELWHSCHYKPPSWREGM